jgi:predicted site-specific integrase-resolvase
MPELLTINEAAERLRMTVRGLQKWHKEGRGPRAAVIAGRLLYQAAEVERFIAEAFEQSA